MAASMILKEHVNKMLLIAFTVTINACNDSGTKGTSVVLKDTSAKDTALKAQSIETRTAISVKHIDSVPYQIKYEGKVVDSKVWKDSNGEHYVLITEEKQGEYLTNSWVSKLNGYMYTKSDTGFALGWRVRDNAAISPEVTYLPKSLTVKDIDNDGKAEVWFFYSIKEDGADPMPLKMILYTEQKKLAIRGVIPRSITDLHLYKKTIDAKAISKEVVNYASKQWDIIAKDQMKAIIGEEVTQSEDFPIKQ